MRTIKLKNQYKRDLKRIAGGIGKSALDKALSPVVLALAEDRTLPPRYRDHPLTGNWAEHRECHIKPDLLLVYSLPDTTTLQLERLGSHSELFR